jgi:biotin-[acetyl-CoA-carboxylase] ligase BirA-like protein
MPIETKKSPTNLLLFHEAVVSSTQDIVFEKTQLQSPGDPWILCLADQQIQGRGTRARGWISSQDPSDQLILSFGRKMDDDFSRLPIHGLSLLVGEALCKSIQSFGVRSERIFLKWPNDLMVAGATPAMPWRKMGGILCEFKKNSLAVGVGLNLKFKPTDIETAASLKDVDSQAVFNQDLRKQLSFKLLETFELAFEDWYRAPAVYMRQLSARLPLELMRPLVGARVIVKKTGAESTVTGLNEEGFLLISREGETSSITVKSSDEIRFFQFSPA